MDDKAEYVKVFREINNDHHRIFEASYKRKTDGINTFYFISYVITKGDGGKINMNITSIMHPVEWLVQLRIKGTKFMGDRAERVHILFWKEIPKNVYLKYKRYINKHKEMGQRKKLGGYL